MYTHLKIKYCHILNTNVIQFVVFKISLDDLHSVSKLLIEALKIRERYMHMSHQSFPTITSTFLHGNSASTQEDYPSTSISNSDTSETIAVDKGQTNLTETKQNYPNDRMIKHEDRQSIAGKPIQLKQFNLL